MKVQQFLTMVVLAATVGVQAQNKEPLARITQFTTGREGGTCPLVSVGADGRLQYVKDDDGIWRN